VANSTSQGTSRAKKVGGVASRIAPPAPPPTRLIDPRPNRPVVLHSADVFVDKKGICYCTDWSGAGLYIMEYGG